MIIEKQDIDDEQRVKIFQALADPTRLEAMRILKQVGRKMSIEELGQYSNLAASTRSYHGKILKDAGLTQTEKVGRDKFVWLNQATFDKFLPGFLDTL